MYVASLDIILLAKPSLRDLNRLQVAPQWYELGLELGLTKSDLDIIEKDDGRDSSTCRRKMFSKWLSSSNDASYSGLVDALVEIDKKDVAEFVSQKFCKLYTYIFGYSFSAQHVALYCSRVQTNVITF